MTWTPLFSFFILILIFAIGNEVSLATRSVFSLMLFSSIVHLIGYWTGLIPTDSVMNTYLPSMLTAYLLPIIVANLGTMMDINQLLGEWKTVVLCLLSLAALGIVSFTVGTFLFGEYAVIASVPISGGGVATILIGDACIENGRPDLAGFAALCNSMDLLIGLPMGAFMIRGQLVHMQKEGKLLSREALYAGEKQLPQINRLNWKRKPAWWTRPYPMLARVTLIALIAYIPAQYTSVPHPIWCLLFGIIASQCGFLELNSLQNAGYWNFLLIVQLCNQPRLLAGVTWDSFKSMILPAFGMLLLGAVTLMLSGLIIGKFLRMPARTSCAVALTAMIGYPNTMLISQDAVATLKDASEEEKAVALGYALPKMLVGGFTTVTFASVAYASIAAQIFFG